MVGGSGLLCMCLCVCLVWGDGKEVMEEKGREAGGSGDVYVCFESRKRGGSRGREGKGREAGGTDGGCGGGGGLIVVRSNLGVIIIKSLPWLMKLTERNGYCCS